MSIGLKIPAVLIQAFHSCCEIFSICTAFDLFTTCTSLSYLQESLQNKLIAMNKQTYPKTGTASTIFYNTAIIMIARRNNPKELTSLKGMARASNLPDILTIDYKFWHTFYMYILIGSPSSFDHPSRREPWLGHRWLDSSLDQTWLACWHQSGWDHTHQPCYSA